MNRQLATTSNLLNRRVQTPGGRTIGKITDLVMDTHRGCVTFAVLVTDRRASLPARTYAVPWSALTPTFGLSAFILNLDPSELIGASPLTRHQEQLAEESVRTLPHGVRRVVDQF